MNYNFNLYEALKNGATPGELDAAFIKELNDATARHAEEFQKKKAKQEELKTLKTDLKEHLYLYVAALIEDITGESIVGEEAIRAEVDGLINDFEKEFYTTFDFVKPLVEKVKKTKETKEKMTDEEIIQDFINKVNKKKPWI